MRIDPLGFGTGIGKDAHMRSHAPGGFGAEEEAHVDAGQSSRPTARPGSGMESALLPRGPIATFVAQLIATRNADHGDDFMEIEEAASLYGAARLSRENASRRPRSTLA